MSFERLLPQLWMVQPKDIKEHLVKVFNVQRTGITEVRDNMVVSDGYTYDDLLAVSKEKMEAYVGSSDTFPRLWELTVAKIKYELNPPVGIIGTEDIIPKPIEEINNNAEISAPIKKHETKKSK